MGKGKDKDNKWNSLIKYLNTTNAKPESVLNLVKQSFGSKGKSKTDDFNLLRRAWAIYVCVGIYNKFGTPEKKKTSTKITNAILYFVESQAYKTNYNLMHPVKTYNQKLKKYEWDSAEESLYEKKTTSQHERNCRKIRDSKKGKELRKHFIRTNGKIPIMYKAQLDPLFEV